MAKKKSDIVVAKDISRLEFIDLIKLQIEAATKSIRQSEAYIKSYVDLYQKTELDMCRYNLKYYVIGEGLTYERVSRKKIGF